MTVAVPARQGGSSVAVVSTVAVVLVLLFLGLMIYALT